jgi:hypothetical protein
MVRVAVLVSGFYELRADDNGGLGSQRRCRRRRRQHETLVTARLVHGFGQQGEAALARAGQGRRLDHDDPPP